MDERALLDHLQAALADHEASLRRWGGENYLKGEALRRAGCGGAYEKGKAVAYTTAASHFRGLLRMVVRQRERRQQTEEG
jgi:hypothetical protein